jgi:hypothetical protein
MIKAMITSVLLNAVSVLILPYEKILETLSMLLDNAGVNLISIWLTSPV